jgi:hypothetical protein
MAPDAAVANRDPLSSQPAGLLFPTVGGQLAVRADHAPPGQTHATRQHVADGTCRARVPGAARNLPVADNLALAQIPDHASYRVGERSGHSGSRRTRLVPCDKDRVRAKHESDARSGRERGRLRRR